MKKVVLLLLLLAGVSWAQRPFFVTAYYAAWAYPGVQLTAIDYSIPTHIIYHSFEPSQSNPDPATGLAYATYEGGMTAFERGPNGAPFNLVDALRDSVSRHGGKLLLGLGGVTSPANFVWIVENNRVAEYVHSISDYCKRRGFSGVDFDWERPAWHPGGREASRVLLKAFYDTLQTWNPKGTITVCAWPNNVDADYYVSDLNNYVDQINPMWYSFDMQAACSWGPSGGNVTYYQAPLWDNGMTNAGSQYWNVNKLFHDMLSIGIRRDKIGFGISGEVAYSSGNTATVPGASPAQCMSWRGDAAALWDNYLVARPQAYQWDARAAQAYVGYQDGTGNHFYIFDDSTSARIKTRYAIDSGMGGVMYWEYFKGNSARLGPNHILRGVKLAMSGQVVSPPPPPPPPPLGTIRDTIYIPVAVHDTVRLTGHPGGYVYFNTALSDSAVNYRLSRGALFLYMGTRNSSGLTPIRGYWVGK